VKYRPLGDSGVRVSEICLGSWLTYGGALEKEQAEACIDAAFAAGINFIDTANVYSGGRAEEFLGEVLPRRPRDSYVLATKVFGEMPNGDQGLSRAQILKQIDDSLERLRTDYVDLYQCHSYDEDVPLEETLEALTEVVAAGKARFIGVSNWSGDQIQSAVELTREHGFAKLVSSQPEYSLLHREPEGDVIPVSVANGISQIVWSPLAQGVLTGKYAPGEAFETGTRAAERGETFMSRYLDDATLERVQRLDPVAESLGITMAQLALAWVLRQPNLASAIVGGSRPGQIADNAAASGIDLDQTTLRAIEEALA
jgi:aryl-alcohol dehydrogenase-like predicted oxidoreductase